VIVVATVSRGDPLRAAVNSAGMAPDVAEVERALLALTPEDRAEVIHRGLLSLDLESGADVDPAAVEGAWRDEIGNRVDEILNGKVELVDADEHYARLRASLTPPNS